MKNRFVISLVATVCLGVSALAQDVRYNFNPSVDFSKYHTYKWVVVQGGIHPDQLVDGQIRSAIDSQLAQKGLMSAQSGDGDIQVAYQIVIDKERQIDAFGTPGWRFGAGVATATTSTINNGTLLVEFFDPGKKELVWRGQGTKTLDPSKDPQKNLERLQKAVAKILKNFPPPIKK